MRLVWLAITTAFLIIILSSFISANTIFDSDVRIIKSDESGITFTYQAPTAELITPDGYPEKFRAPRINRTAQIAKPGEPLLPVKVVPIGVPYNSKPTVTVIDGQFTPLAEVEVPNFIIENSEEQFKIQAGKQVPSKTWPLKIVYIEGENMIRGLRVIKVCLAAAILESGMLHQAKSITVRVDFHNDGALNNNFARPNGRIFENILSEIVANYDIARNWRVDWPPIPFKTASAQSVFDSSQVWIKLETSSEGIYKVSRFELNATGVDVAAIDPREMRVFYGGGGELPIDNYIERPEFREIPIYITGSDDGEFNDSDRLLFYAESVDGLQYDEPDERFVYRFHHYTEKNVYWLTYGGSFSSSPRRWSNVNGAPQSPSAVTVSSFTDVAHDEQDMVFYISPNDGTEPTDHFNWFRGSSSSFSVTKQLKDVVSGSQSLIVLKTKTAFDSLLVNEIPAERTSTFSGGFTEYSTTELRGNTGFNTFYLKDNADFYYDFINIYYERWLNANNDHLLFTGPETNYNIEYHLTGVPPNYMLLDISSSDSVAQIMNGELSGGSLEFQNFSDGRKRFFLFTSANYRNVNDYEIYEPDDLRSTANGADYIIITNELFYDQAQELADHRESISPDIRTRVVKVDDIYNQFSWGLFDATAIRDFLKYAFENWSGAAPSYAVLVGDGHYDYRDNLNENVPNLIPPYESTQSSTNRDPYGSDESYVYFGEIGYLDSDGSGLDMIIGRLAVNNTSQMQIVLDKIINYESNPDMGKWRNNVIIAADDNNVPGPNGAGETMHTRQAESLATECVPAELEVTKIYLVEYPIRAGRTKPDAREALINAFNDGGLIVDWIGHGNKGLWAHEQLFRRIEDMPRLVNGDKLPLVFAASCSIAYFDHPNEQGMSEDFVRHPGGGAIASIGATRLVLSSPNSELNKDFFTQLLFGDSVSFGQALYVVKYLRVIPPEFPNDNWRKFTFLGDPALIAGKPALNAEFTYEPDSLKGLTVDSIAGNITDDLGELQSDFNGTVWVLVKDASINRHKVLVNYSGVPTGSYLDYELPGPTIFNGPADVVNGRFSTSFFIPKDISYGGTGAKIYVYFENGYIDGSGVIDSLPMAGGVSSEPDTAGPTIEIYYNNQSLADRMQAVPTNPTFEVRLFDLHGINVTGSMGHNIKIEVDNGETYTRDITDDFIFDRGDWQQGLVAFTIPDLPEGEHLLSLKAWDNYNNSALLSTYIQVFADDNFAISEVMNYPNPVVKTDSTTFQYMLSNDADMVSLKIFTLAGRKIKTFDLSAPDYTSSGFHNITYYLRDSDNDKLGSGVYIYKIEAIGTGFDGERRSSSFQSKLAILR